MATRIAGIQPGHLPCLGYFGPMLHTDALLLAEDVGVSVHVRALPLHRFFRDAGHRLQSLPPYPSLKEPEQDQVEEALLRILGWYAA